MEDKDLKRTHEDLEDSTEDDTQKIDTVTDIQKVQERPSSVHYSFYALLGYIFISTLDFSLQKFGAISAINSSDDFIGYLLNLIITLLLFSSILGRKNWARGIYAGLFVFSLPVNIYGVYLQFDIDTIVAIFTTVETLLLVLSVFYLFVNTSSAWFTQEISDES